MAKDHKKSKDDKSTKKSLPTNQDTVVAGLEFNVRSVLKGMKAYLRENDMLLEREKTDEKTKKTEVVRELPKFSGGNIAMASVLEFIYGVLVSESLKQSSKDKTELKAITVQHVINAVELNQELRRAFHMDIEAFDEKQSYSVPVDSKDIKRLLEKNFKGAVVFKPQGEKMIEYLLLQTFIRILRTSHDLLVYAGRKSLNANAVRTCVNIYFSGNFG